jgi:hypothetical protein
MATSLYPFLSNRDKISEICGNVTMIVIVVVLRETKCITVLNEITNVQRQSKTEQKCDGVNN